MEKQIRILLLILFVSFLGAGCGKDCAREECPNVVPATFAFRLLNGSDQDLLAGPAKVYDTTAVKIRARRATSNTIDDIQRSFIVIKNSTGSADSILTTGFIVTNTYASYYLVLNNVVTDSLIFGLNNRKSICCDFSTYFLDKVNTNDIQDITLPAFYIIRK